MAEEPLDEVLRTTLHNAQRGVRSAVYKVFKEVMLHLIREEIIEETLKAHIASYFDANAASTGLSKMLLVSCAFMAPIAKLAGRKTNNAIENEKYSVTHSSIQLMYTVEPYNDKNKSLQSRSKSGSEELPCRKSS